MHSAAEPAYIVDLRKAGLDGFSAADVRLLKTARIDGAFVRSRSTPSHVPSVPELLRAKA